MRSKPKRQHHRFALEFDGKRVDEEKRSMTLSLIWEGMLSIFIMVDGVTGYAECHVYAVYLGLWKAELFLRLLQIRNIS